MNFFILVLLFLIVSALLGQELFAWKVKYIHEEEISTNLYKLFYLLIIF